MKFRTGVVLAALAVSLISPTTAQAVAPLKVPAAKINLPVKLASEVKAAQVFVGTQYKLAGTVTPVKKGVVVQRQRLLGGKWKPMANGTATTNARGEWSFKMTAPTAPTTLKIRVIATNVKKSNSVLHTITVVRPPSVSIKASTAPHPSGAFTTLTGNFADLGDNVAITLQQQLDGQWSDLPGAVTLGTSGWAARVQLPTAAGSYSFHVTATGSLGTVVSSDVAVTVLPATATAFTRLGPGSPSRIWGLDVSRWNHMADTNGDGVKDINDAGLPIDFNAAYNAGVRFVFIKASDGNDLNNKADQFALKFAAADRAAAQAAGIMTGFYHYIGMPEVQDYNALMLDAHREAIQAASRVAAVGGYNSMDLPYVLDFESDSIGGSGFWWDVKKEWLTAWVKVWVTEMEQRTGRKPIIYSSPSVLGAKLVDDGSWQSYPLWTAVPTCRFAPATTGVPCTADVLNAGALPGYSSTGIYPNPWWSGNVFNWSFWQYGTAPGLPLGVLNSSRVDVNVFGGTDDQFSALLNQPWVPFSGDYQASASPVTLTATYDYPRAGQAVVVHVKAVRSSNGAAAVSGELAVTQLAVAVPNATVLPTGIGTWDVTLPSNASGFVWDNLSFDFTDQLNFYAPTSTLLTIPVL